MSSIYDPYDRASWPAGSRGDLAGAEDPDALVLTLKTPEEFRGAFLYYAPSNPGGSKAEAPVLAWFKAAQLAAVREFAAGLLKTQEESNEVHLTARDDPRYRLNRSTTSERRIAKHDGWAYGAREAKTRIEQALIKLEEQE